MRNFYEAAFDANIAYKTCFLKKILHLFLYPCMGFCNVLKQLQSVCIIFDNLPLNTTFSCTCLYVRPSVYFVCLLVSLSVLSTLFSSLTISSYLFWAKYSHFECHTPETLTRHTHTLSTRNNI